MRQKIFNNYKEKLFNSSDDTFGKYSKFFVCFY